MYNLGFCQECINAILVLCIETVNERNLVICLQLDPLQGLDLASFACKTVSVRFAVLNKVGMSDFSNSTEIQVYGGN